MKAFTTDVIALKKLMIDNNIKNIKELAERSHVDRNTLAKVLNGSAQPSTNVMQKLMICLNIEPVAAGPIFFSIDLHNTQVH